MRKSKLIVWTYLLSICFILLPPVYFITPLFNSHTASKLIWVLLLYIVSIRNKKIIGVVYEKWKPFLLFSSLYFISQIISIINTQNIVAYLTRFEDILFIGLFVLLSIFIISFNKAIINKVLNVFVITASINICIQAIILFNPQLFQYMSRYIMHPVTLDLIMIKLFEGKLFLSIDEYIVPILMYSILFRDKKNRYKYFGILILVLFFAVISNIRTRSVMVLFALLSFIVVYWSKLKRYVFMLILLAVPICVALYISTILYGFNFIDRTIYLDNPEDYRSVVGRFDRWEKSVEIGRSKPLFGVGLGNYYDYLTVVDQKNYSQNVIERKLSAAAAYDPHNIFFSIFAETGFIGLSSFIILLVYFIYIDIQVMKQELDINKVFVLSFWTIFIFSVFNPAYTIPYLMVFWLLRVLINAYILK